MMAEIQLLENNSCYGVPVDNFGTVVGENPDCLLLYLGLWSVKIRTMSAGVCIILVYTIVLLYTVVYTRIQGM